MWRSERLSEGGTTGRRSCGVAKAGLGQNCFWVAASVCCVMVLLCMVREAMRSLAISCC